MRSLISSRINNLIIVLVMIMLSGCLQHCNSSRSAVLSSQSVKTEQTQCNWCNLVADERNLMFHFDEISFNIRTKLHTLGFKPIKLRIGEYIIDQLLPNPQFSTIFIGFKLIRLMLTWYENAYLTSKIDEGAKLKLNPIKMQEFLAFMQSPLSSSLFCFNQIRDLLNGIFRREKNKFYLFYEWIYYKPYISWIGNDNFVLTTKIGTGQQANVFGVRDTNNGNYYALKLFFQRKYCFREENVLSKIEKDIYLSSTSTHNVINVPRIITDYNISCIQHHAILMQYIQGTQFDAGFLSTARNAASISKQIGDIIQKLSLIGIGHFDIQQGNILVDEDGNCWLIDWGLAVMITQIKGCDYWYANENEYPIIGTWAFYSKAAYQLNTIWKEFIINGDKPVAKSKQEIDKWKQLIYDANMYSLQAMLFSYCDDLKLLLHNHNRCDQIWIRTEHDKIDDRIYNILNEMWSIRTSNVWKYLNNTKGGNVLNKAQLSMLL